MKTAIIMPSIRTPQNLEAWSALLSDDDVFIIAGNERSPHEDIEVALLQAAVKHPGVTYDYLRPTDKRCTETYINEFIEANHTHRRNFALLEALRYGADMIVTIDDDNFPAHDPNWIIKAGELLTQPNDRPVVGSTPEWFNPGQLCMPYLTHRGYPVSQRHQPHVTSYVEAKGERIGVVAGLWLGDPDVDAMERITIGPMVDQILTSVTLTCGTWGPFDSQSTAVHRELAPLMFMWTNVGRYDDIWCSYLMRAIMDATRWHVTYGEPLVRQERNPHNLIRDLKDELFGYEHTETLCKALRDMASDITAANNELRPWEMFRLMINELQWYCPLLPGETTDGLKAWIKDVDDLSPV